MKEIIEYGEDFIRIKRIKDGVQIAYWIEDEWIAEPQVVFSICHAIQLATRNKLEEFLHSSEIKL